MFLDKDGTLLEDVPYNVAPDRVQPVEGMRESVRILRDAGYRLIVVSNQSGIARGLFTEDALGPVEMQLRARVAEAGVSLDGFYYCPHHPQGAVAEYAVECLCRKPKPGMLYKAAQEHNIDLGASWMVGDILNDVEAGNRAGCRTVLIDNNHETEWDLSPWRRPNYLVPNLLCAARVITGAIDPFEWSFCGDAKKQRSP